MFVIRVHDQEHVQRFNVIRIDLIGFAGNGEHHLQEVLTVREVVIRIIEGLANRLLIGVRSDGRQFGHQAVD